MSKSMGEQLEDLGAKPKINRNNISKGLAPIVAAKKVSSRTTPCRPARRKKCGKFKELVKKQACQVNGCDYILRSKI